MAKEVSQTGREKRLGARAAPYLATAARPRARAMDDAVPGERRAARSIASLEVGQGDARVLLLEFDQQPVAQHLLRGARRGGFVETVLRGGGEHLGLGGVRAHGTRVTARVPESTRTTGRTRASVRPMRRAAWVHGTRW